MIYCKFWDIDTDHDMFISQKDLENYDNEALTTKVVARIMQQHGRKFSKLHASDLIQKQPTMSFVDFACKNYSNCKYFLELLK